MSWCYYSSAYMCKVRYLWSVLVCHSSSVTFLYKLFSEYVLYDLDKFLTSPWIANETILEVFLKRSSWTVHIFSKIIVYIYFMDSSWTFVLMNRSRIFSNRILLSHLHFIFLTRTVHELLSMKNAWLVLVWEFIIRRWTVHYLFTNYFHCLCLANRGKIQNQAKIDNWWQIYVFIFLMCIHYTVKDLVLAKFIFLLRNSLLFR